MFNICLQIRVQTLVVSRLLYIIWLGSYWKPNLKPYPVTCAKLIHKILTLISFLINLTEPPQKQHDIKSLKNFILNLFLILKSVHSYLTIELFQIFSVLAMGYRVDAVLAAPMLFMVGPVWQRRGGGRGSWEKEEDVAQKEVKSYQPSQSKPTMVTPYYRRSWQTTLLLRKA